MSEESESPMERLTEQLHEEAVHGHEAWLKWSALLSALFAVLAAISGLLSTQYANDAMIEQIQASDQWSYYQAKGIKSAMAQAETEILAQLGKAAPAAAEPEKYRLEQTQIETAANKLTASAQEHLGHHEMLSRAVTLFQVSIAVIAISVLTRRRHFLWVSVAMAAVGIVFFAQGLL